MTRSLTTDGFDLAGEPGRSARPAPLGAFNAVLARAGVAGLSALVVALPFVIALALPVVDLGIFRQVETVTVALHASAALASFLLLLVSIGDIRMLRPALGLPVLAPAALGVVGLVAAPVAEAPLRSVVGSLEHGVGAAWFLELALLTLAATVVRRERPRAFAAAAWSCAASVAACIGLQVLQIPYGAEPFVPYEFKEYIGLHALVAAAALLALGRRPAAAAGLVLALAGLGVSGNRAAWLAALAALAAYAVLSRMRPAPARRALALGAPALAAVALAAVSLSTGLWQDLAERGAERGTVQSVAPVDWAAVQLKPYGTLWDRGVTADMTLRSIAETPIRILAGRGFGSFETLTVERRREAPGRRFVVPNETAARAYWDGDQKAKFHSHNLLLEAMLGAGIGGAVAWLAYLGGLGRAASRRALPGVLALVAALAVGGSFWFLVNAALPLLAIAAAAIAPAALPRRGPPPAPGAAAAGVTAVLALGFVAPAGLAATHSSAERTVMYERYFIPLPFQAACVGYTAVGIPERQVNVNLYRMFVQVVASKGAGAAADLVERAAVATNLSCLMRRYAEDGDVEAMDASLTARARLLGVMGPRAEELMAILGPDLNGWVGDIQRFLEKAPGRTDVLLPFIDWAEGTGRGDRILQAEPLLADMSDADPVKPLLTAAVRKARNDYAGRDALLARSLDLGLANLVPVPEPVARAIRERAAAK